jgi:Fic family protein
MSLISKPRGASDWQGNSAFIEEYRGLLDRYEEFLPAKFDSKDLAEMGDLCEMKSNADGEFNADAFYKEKFKLLRVLANCPGELNIWGKRSVKPKEPISPGGTTLSSADIQALQTWDAVRWRLHIDPKHQLNGSRAYDKGGNATENNFERSNYSTNIMSGEKFLSTLTRPIDASVYCELHARCMNKKPGHGEIKPSQFRGAPPNLPILVTIRTGAFGAIDKETLQQKPRTKGQVHEYVEEKDVVRHQEHSSTCFSGGVRSYLQDTSLKVAAYVEDGFRRYHAAIESATTADQKITAIAELYKALECAHPFDDGNGRTNRLLLNELLKRNNLSETMLSNCSCAHFMSVNEVVNEIKRGQEEYAYIATLSHISEEEKTKAICAWESKNGVQIEFSIECGEKLQSLWEDFHRYEEHAESLIAALEELNAEASTFPGIAKRHQKDLVTKLQTTNESLKAIHAELLKEYLLQSQNYKTAPNDRRISQLRHDALHRISNICAHITFALNEASNQPKSKVALSATS